MSARSLCLVLLMAVTASAFLNAKISPWQHENRLAAKKTTWFCNGKPMGTNLSCTEDWIEQPLDNFDPSNTLTWKMRYQIMSDYWNKSTDSPVVFLFIGGEDEISPYWVGDPNIQYLMWAKHFGALVYQTEHRFFGKSRPTADMSNDNLKYCTTKQALEDLATFIMTMNNKNKFKNPRWVTFGGSYPGSMAAWFRSKYPDLTVGSVASSAPLYLKLDFNEYTLVMQNTIKNVSQQCADAVDKSFAYMSKMALTKAGRDSLNDIFNCQPKFNNANVTKLQIYNFFGNVFAPFQDIIQYTYDGLGPSREVKLTVHHLCELMTTYDKAKKYPEGSPQDYAYRAANVVDLYNVVKAGGVQPMINDYQDTIKDYQAVSFDGNNPAGRGWMWLCCNEIGFLQTTELGYNIFHDLVPMNYYMQQCEDMFNMKAADVRDRNHAAQLYYGGVDYFNATNLVLPNGSLDPWHALGYYKPDKANHVVPHLIEGTAHCGDMYGDYKNEPTEKELDKVHKIIFEELQYYLKSN